jgi:TRAP-type C4-dicarboxylate transport system permease small subunit
MDALSPEDASAGRLVGALARLVGLLGGFGVLVVAMVATTSVGLRLNDGRGLFGDFDIAEMVGALAAFAFFPLCLATRGNIAVDAFTARLPRRVLRVIDGFWEIALALVAGFLAWRLTLGGLDHLATNTNTMALGLPIGAAILGCAALAAVWCLVGLVCGLRQMGLRP